jgi:hypothetical protein
MKQGDVGYGLEVRLDITKKVWYPSGPGDDGYWSNNQNERLSINETIDLGSVNFKELLRVLAELHEAVKKVTEENK